LRGRSNGSSTGRRGRRGIDGSVAGRIGHFREIYEKVAQLFESRSNKFSKRIWDSEEIMERGNAGSVKKICGIVRHRSKKGRFGPM
jgi:hypothetical protein